METLSLLRLGGRKVGETVQFAEECMAPHKNDILDPLTNKCLLPGILCLHLLWVDTTNVKFSSDMNLALFQLQKIVCIFQRSEFSNL
jgi:hypothetical protein